MSEEKKESVRENSVRRLLEFTSTHSPTRDQQVMMLRIGIVDPVMTMKLIDRAFPGWERTYGVPELSKPKEVPISFEI